MYASIAWPRDNCSLALLAPAVFSDVVEKKGRLVQRQDAGPKIALHGLQEVRDLLRIQLSPAPSALFVRDSKAPAVGLEASWLFSIFINAQCHEMRADRIPSRQALLKRAML